MPCIARVVVRGIAYHFTKRGNQREWQTRKEK
jgi:hypothetical protein